MLDRDKLPILGFLTAGAIVGYLLIMQIITLSADTVELANAKLAKLEAVKKETKKREEEYLREVSTAKPKVKPHLEKAEFEKGFDKSKAEIANAEKTASAIKQLLVEDSFTDDSLVVDSSNKLSQMVYKISLLNKAPFQDKKDLIHVIENADTTYSSLKDKLLYNKKFLTGSIDKVNAYAEKHPNKKVYIGNNLQQISLLAKSNDDLLSVLETDYGEKNYLKLYRSVETINDFNAESKKSVKSIFAKLTQLDRSYSRILLDMDERYFVTIARASWDNYSDFDDTNTHTYKPVEVTADDFKKLVEAEGLLVSGYISSPVIRNSAWRLISNKINMKEGIRYSDDEAEYWVESATVKHYHKYMIIENGVKRTEDWKEVSPDLYDKHFEHLGMEILSKPYGKFEDEAVTSASPAGIGYVGNSRYGEWRYDSSGRSFWHYYGMYSFFNDMTGGRYYRNDYDYYRDYSRRNQPYYGSNNRYGTFGSSTYKNKTYANGSFAKRNKISSGGLNNIRRDTVRGSGQASRGRGASGGGK